MLKDMYQTVWQMLREKKNWTAVITVCLIGLLPDYSVPLTVLGVSVILGRSLEEAAENRNER
jgi:hypothetical protein